MTIVEEAETAVHWFTTVPAKVKAWVFGAIAVLLIVNVWNWHERDIGAQQCEAAVNKVSAQAAADHDAQQAKIDELAKSAQPELAKKLAQQQRDINTLVAAASKPPKVLQGQCTVPPDQVAAYNGIGK